MARLLSPIPEEPAISRGYITSSYRSLPCSCPDALAAEMENPFEIIPDERIAHEQAPRPSGMDPELAQTLYPPHTMMPVSPLTPEQPLIETPIKESNPVGYNEYVYFVQEYIKVLQECIHGNLSLSKERELWALTTNDKHMKLVSDIIKDDVERYKARITKAIADGKFEDYAFYQITKFISPVHLVKGIKIANITNDELEELSMELTRLKDLIHRCMVQTKIATKKDGEFVLNVASPHKCSRSLFELQLIVETYQDLLAQI